MIKEFIQLFNQVVGEDYTAFVDGRLVCFDTGWLEMSVLEERLKKVESNLVEMLKLIKEKEELANKTLALADERIEQSRWR